jgi:hypothetical protein
MRLSVLLLVAILACLSLTMAASTPRARLIIHKELIGHTPGVFAATYPLNVSISVTNVGTGPAYSVTIADNWGELFELIGSNSTEVEELGVGKVAVLNFTVIPSKEGHFNGGAAQVTYIAETDGNVQNAYSSGWRQFTVYPADVYAKYTASKTVEWILVLVGFAVVVLVPLGVWSYIQFNYEHGIANSLKAKSS